VSRILVGLAIVGSVASGTRAGTLPPTFDEQWDAAIPAHQDYRVQISIPEWVVPGDSLPRGLALGPSNNNVSLCRHDGRLFLAWRTAPTHFASKESRIHVISSATPEGPWTLETTIALGRDVREPFLLSVGSRLFLYFAELGDEAFRFEPNALWRMERLGPGAWSEKVQWGGPGEVAWDFKVRRGRVWMTSYRGDRYHLENPDIALRFRWSEDGIAWNDAPVPDSVVYRGGVSEAAFEFDADGRLWAVTRNEDGDATGFGSHLVSAPADAPWAWSFPDKSDPDRHDSPRLFRHGGDLYLIARRDPTRVYDWTGDMAPRWAHRLLVLSTYSLRPKATALYRIDTVARRLVYLCDLPGAGDTAFPSIVRMGPHEVLVANYTSAALGPGAPWIQGQLSDTGTSIYLVHIRFVPGREESPRVLSARWDGGPLESAPATLAERARATLRRILEGAERLRRSLRSPSVAR
jgi:hypothetical protein